MTGDTAYGAIENIVGIEDQGMRAYVPLPDFDQRTPFYGLSKFIYDPERDEHLCPEGKPLRRRTASFTVISALERIEAPAFRESPSWPPRPER